MRKLVVTVTVVLVPTGYAEASPLTGETVVNPGVNYSLIEKTGCWFP